MTNQSTIDKLIEMRLTAMADAFRIQMDDPAMKEVPFEDRFGMLVDVEYSNRKNNRLKRLIRQAEFEQPDASIAAIDYHSGRKLNKALINRLATCEYITEYRNIFITGATGSGKTYMACAFGMHTLFTLEDLYGLHIDEIDGELCLRLDKAKGTTYLSMFDMFHAWQEQAEKLKSGEITQEEYDQWRYNYPKNAK